MSYLTMGSYEDTLIYTEANEGAREQLAQARAMAYVQNARQRRLRALAMPTFLSGMGSLGNGTFSTPQGTVTIRDLGNGQSEVTLTTPLGATRRKTIDTYDARSLARSLSSPYQQTADRLARERSEYERFRQQAESGNLPPGVDNFREWRQNNAREEARTQRLLREQRKREEAKRRSEDAERRQQEFRDKIEKAKEEARERREAREAREREERARRNKELLKNAKAAGYIGPPITRYPGDQRAYAYLHTPGVAMRVGVNGLG